MTRDSVKGNLPFGLMLLLMVPFLVIGCAANVTRSLPCTPVHPGITDTAPTLKGSRLGVLLFDYSEAKIEGGHHEGLLQVRQPWIFGLSGPQKEALYGNAGKLAALSFASELKRQGIPVTLLTDTGGPSGRSYDLLVAGKVDRIILNTYGRGTKEGLGSAGNYWEATVFFSNIQLKDIQSNRILGTEDIESYAKLDNSPAKLDWTMLTVAVKSLQGALYLHQMQAASSPLTAISKAKRYVETWEADYTLDDRVISPIEVAARHAAAQFLQKIRLNAQ